MPSVISLFFVRRGGSPLIRFLQWENHENQTLAQLRKSEQFTKAQSGIFDIFEETVFTRFNSHESLREDIPLAILFPSQESRSIYLKQLDGIVPVPTFISSMTLNRNHLTVLWSDAAGNLGSTIQFQKWEDCKNWPVKYLRSQFYQPGIRGDDIQVFLPSDHNNPLYPEAILKDCIGDSRRLIAKFYSPPSKQAITALQLVSLIVKDKVGQCSICLEDLIRSDHEDEIEIRQINQCKHLFHVKCLSEWLIEHKTCPLCRTVLLA